MAITKAEAGRVLGEFWKLLPYAELEDEDGNRVLLGTVVSTAEPPAGCVAWVKPTDTANN